MTGFDTRTRYHACSSLALLSNGLQAGALLFVSRVSAPTLTSFVQQPNPNQELIRTFFPIWWPNGRDLMRPLIFITTFFYACSWYFSKKVVI